MLASFARLEPRAALRAARALLRDPDDLPQVFTLIEALQGGTLDRVAKRLSWTTTGRGLLAIRPDIYPLLADHAALRDLPEGSLGRAYLEFMEAEAISADGIQEADARGKTLNLALGVDEQYVAQRLRDTHDLWHAVTGYKGDVLGEVALLAFTLAQTWNPALLVIVVLGLAKTYGAPDSRALIVDGFRRGRRADWFPGQDWESMLALPVADVRRRLGVDAPPAYAPVRSAELKARASA